MQKVKRAIYLDADVDAALRQSANDNDRSITGELNYILRHRLLRHMSLVGGRDVTPDPKAKPRRRSS
jgi:hypothetical protein